MQKLAPCRLTFTPAKTIPLPNRLGHIVKPVWPNAAYLLCDRLPGLTRALTGLIYPRTQKLFSNKAEMRQVHVQGWLTGGMLLSFTCAVLFQPHFATAQPLPDNTLPIRTTVTSDRERFLIEGGTPAGSHLFHSFESFSIPLGGKATFRPEPTIKTVFSRVTGNTPSQLEGLLRVEGTADFFLLNPNGVTFGQNASLDLNGSFLATTADQIQFSDGQIFTVREDPSFSSLLSLSSPTGLQFGQNPGAITNRSAASPSRDRPMGLQVQPDKTLALMGGPINLIGGHIVSPQSDLKLGAVSKGSWVGLSPNESGYSFDYEGVENFQDIQISQLSTIDSSGVQNIGIGKNGAISLRGKQIIVSGGSQISARNLSTEPGGNIDVEASDIFAIIGTASPLNGPFETNSFVQAPQRSRVSSNILGPGKGATINIKARKVSLQDGGILGAEVRGAGTGGELSIQASELVEVLGQAPLIKITNLPLIEAISKLSGVDSDFFANGLTATIISVTNFSSGQSGNLEIQTKRLNVSDGGIINLGPFSSGAGGDAQLTAEQIEVSGSNPGENYPSAITVAALPLPDATGTPGDLLIDTAVLKIQDGGRLGLDTTSDSGALGIINASQSVEITGTSRTGKFESLISGRSAVGGIGGRVELNTGELRITDKGGIFVAGVSASEGGDVKVVADSVLLSNQAIITTETVQGDLGGNINLDVRDSVLLLGNSKISAAAGAEGNGGNVTIKANLIATASPENSDIIASAFEGNGGTIQITANGILGFASNDTITPQSDITASSQGGMDGIVAIEAPDVNPASVEVELNDTIELPSLTQDCIAVQTDNNNFIHTGRGGLPIDPLAPSSASNLWQDLAPLHPFPIPAQQGWRPIIEASGSSLSSIKSVPKEANYWSLANNGKVKLIASKESSFPQLAEASTCNSI